MDNFFSRPVGASVLFLNDFHFGKRLNDLNRCARLVPKDVKALPPSSRRCLTLTLNTLAQSSTS